MMGFMSCLRSEVILDGPGNLVLVEESGDFAPDNLALTGTAFALDLINNGAFRPSHDIPNLNDGIYGNGNSWIGNSLNSFCGINLGTTEMTISSIAFGRDNTGTYSDRAGDLRFSGQLARHLQSHDHQHDNKTDPTRVFAYHRNPL
tara:strand:+ start:1762 stop:2199 length:438 start_codon:yes stop_codon:yes gene_type:complete